MATGLAQEQLQRVGGGFVGEWGGGGDRGRFHLIVGDLDPALLQLAMERVDVEGIEIEQLDQLDQLARTDRARVLGGVE